MPEEFHRGRHALSATSAPPRPIPPRNARLRAAGSIAASAAAFGLYTRVYGLWMPLGWIGLVPFLGVLNRTASAKAALLVGWAMSVAFVLAVFGWFAPAISTYTGSSPAVSLALLMLVAPLLQPQFVTFALARHWMQAACSARAQLPFPSAITAAFAAFVYVGTESVWPKLFGDTIGYGFYPSPWLRQVADLCGAPGLTFLVVMLNELALPVLDASTWRENRQRALTALASAATLLLTMTGYGAYRLSRITAAETGSQPLTAALVQANIGNYERLRANVGGFEAVRTILDTHFELSRAAMQSASVDMVVWPETAYPTTFGSPKTEAGAEFDNEIRSFAANLGRPVVFGSYDIEQGREFNTATFLDPVAADPERHRSYRKTHLFPLTERVPPWLESPRLRSWLPWLGTWHAGTGAVVLPIELAGGRVVQVAPLICLDAVEPDMSAQAARNGAELLLTLSNDGWFAGGNGARLHLIVSAFRSIETHLPQLRATNTGVSTAITASGDLKATADVDERRALVASVFPMPATRTPMVMWGNWFGPFSILAAALLALATKSSTR